MIPQFPQFKKLELSDKNEIEIYTKDFPPYSDFNFVSMWSWDIKQKIRISILYNNLIVRFTDYLTTEPFYSFIGCNKINETVEILLNFSISHGLEPLLKLVPEECLQDLDLEKFSVTADRNHFDYILPSSLLCEYNTRKTRNKKKAVAAFLRKFKSELKLLNLDDTVTKNEVIALVLSSFPNTEDVFQNEFLAISRFIENHKKLNIIALGLYINNQLVGFKFSEILNNKYATAHFWKANVDISQYIYSYLMQEKAKLLQSEGCEFINIEQDLGLENLRSWKSSYGCDHFLKKYIVNRIAYNLS